MKAFAVALLLGIGSAGTAFAQGTKAEAAQE
jgi:F0F1-type ATP synthase membrane subunit c/vacuolar-type H+-ATPase subunit K